MGATQSLAHKLIVQTVGPKHSRLRPRSDVAKALGRALPYYTKEFGCPDGKGPVYYEMGAIFEDTGLFREVLSTFIARYQGLGNEGPTHIVALEARGFILGSCLALALELPFVIIRKAAKLPGVTVGHADNYIRAGAIRKGHRVLIVDDLIATGWTAISAIELVTSGGAKVFEVAAIADISAMQGVQNVHEFKDGAFKDVPFFTLIQTSSTSDLLCCNPKKGRTARNRTIEQVKAGNYKFLNVSSLVGKPEAIPVYDGNNVVLHQEDRTAILGENLPKRF
ncbi:hypothetical protein CYMTET_20852 [Cymbomonas tetramitiformis]|uniref:adenine phosphoribosyltransferase n=1 Tax=Cymbomonas tetramitiformis TaxID=36881 RepID=A0AAE0G365_9CHLO|nr:hypothetical protein CYMTET_20852 [Cymbomonas tetramitiformis]